MRINFPYFAFREVHQEDLVVIHNFIEAETAPALADYIPHHGIRCKIAEILKAYGEPTINDGKLSFGKGWNMVDTWLNGVISNFQCLNIGMIFITHMEEKHITKPNGEQVTVWRSTLQDRAKSILFGLADFIWFFKKEGKSRWIYTQGDVTIEAGSRITLPDRIPMGRSPQEAYSNILTAFYGRDGNKDKAKSELLDRILRGEAYLAEKKIDGFLTGYFEQNLAISNELSAWCIKHISEIADKEFCEIIAENINKDFVGLAKIGKGRNKAVGKDGWAVFVDKEYWEASQNFVLENGINIVK